MSTEPRGILVVDLGAQYAQLIARRVREANVWSRIAPPARALETARSMNLGGIILSGGPASVYESDAPRVPRELLELGVPVLGICYGLQWMAQVLGGEVRLAERRQFGRTSIEIQRSEAVLEGIDGRTVVWMSHGDNVMRLPSGFDVLASSEECEFAAVVAPARKLHGVQFHPEVSHTVRGREILENFVWRVCGIAGEWTSDSSESAHCGSVAQGNAETRSWPNVGPVRPCAQRPAATTSSSSAGWRWTPAPAPWAR